MTTTPNHRIRDVIVVGSRCAGASTAMLLAAQGHDVVVVDRAMFPSDTLSTHGLARTGVVQLSRWGLLDDVLAAGTPAIRQTTFHTGDEQIARPIKDRAGVDFVIAPRRHVLDTILAAAAAREGADVRTGAVVRGVLTDKHGRVTGVHGDQDGVTFELRARSVIGADGLRSRIARSVSAPVIEDRPSTASTQYAYYAGNWPATEDFLSDGALAGIFPTNGGEACVWVCAPADVALGMRRDHADLGAAFDALVNRSAPGLAARLTDRTSPVRASMRLPNQFRSAWGSGWALVGDAGYHRDPVTGQGISDAFSHAELLADAVDLVLRGECDEATAMAAYQSARDASVRETFELTCALAAFPPVAQFVALQKQLGQAIDTRAVALAARPRRRPATLAA